MLSDYLSFVPPSILFVFADIWCDKMPQWYYEKKELKDTPSYLAGLEYSHETRYRREGAR